MKTQEHWVVVGDIHDDMTHFHRIPELEGASGVLVTGDITFAGGIAKAERVMEKIASAVPAVWAQIGNMDKPEVTSWLEDKGWNIHADAKELMPGIVVLGLGCSPATPFHTPSEYSEQQMELWLEQAYAHAMELKDVHEKSAKVTNQPPALSHTSSAQLVLVSHTPPYDTRCDKLRDGTSVGSMAVRQFIERHQPLLCLCGHIHEARGEDSIGATRILNPGPLGEGGYLVLRFTQATGLLDASLHSTLALG